jgi:hypothetical protein
MLDLYPLEILGFEILEEEDKLELLLQFTARRETIAADALNGNSTSPVLFV